MLCLFVQYNRLSSGLWESGINTGYRHTKKFSVVHGQYISQKIWWGRFCEPRKMIAVFDFGELSRDPFHEEPHGYWESRLLFVWTSVIEFYFMKYISPQVVPKTTPQHIFSRDTMLIAGIDGLSDTRFQHICRKSLTQSWLICFNLTTSALIKYNSNYMTGVAFYFGTEGIVSSILIKIWQEILDLGVEV